MKLNKLLLTTQLVMLLNISNLYSQEGFSMVGGDIFGSTGSSSFTIGQTVYTANESSKNSIYQGVQQPFITFIIEEEAKLNYNCLVYPNPTIQEAGVLHTFAENEVLGYELYDIKGSFVKNGLLENSNNKIDMQFLKSGTYLLNLISKGKPTKTCKIIKSN